MPQLTIQQAFELALSHHRAGRLREAEQIYVQVIAFAPQHADSLHMLGTIAGQSGRPQAAAKLIRQAIALNPNCAEAYNNLAVVLRDMGQLDDAIAAWRRAIVLKPGIFQSHSNLGNALREKGEVDEAIAACRQAIRLQPGDAKAHNNLGIALKENGLLDEAIAAYQESIQLAPSVAEPYHNLGNALKEKGQFDEAITATRQAIALRRDFLQAWISLGNSLADQGLLDEATAAFEKAIELQPNYEKAHSNVAATLNERGDLEKAIAAPRQDVDSNPDFAEAHLNLALTLLARGDFERGWQEHEWRLKCNHPHAARRVFAQPHWDGSPLAGRTILLHVEQGLGDTLQFVRYVPLVAQFGGRIIVECQPELQRLIQRMHGGLQVIARGQPLPAFDVQSSLFSLPKIFKTTLASIPAAVPYLVPDTHLVDHWRKTRLVSTPGLKVGLVWVGNPAHKKDRFRSIPLDRLSPLAQVPGVTYFNLQKEDTQRQPDRAPSALLPYPLLSAQHDFADTAAAISCTDLIITVDTSVAHLAGAMGHAVWILLPFSPDWRWLLGRADSPWYPSMRLFRQPALGDWDSVLAAVASALHELVLKAAMNHVPEL